MKQSTKESFQQIVWSHYSQNGRTFAWRVPESNNHYDSYKILVSEIMLQQTSVVRAEPKFLAFIEAFPTLQVLARATRHDVLRQWSGLGYNRRAIYLHRAAQYLASQAEPWSIEQLVACKGIGHNTAAAVCVYTYNQPHVFVETNVRTVYIHHFFSGAEAVSDTALTEVIRQTVDTERPREFYWALMDYGSWLKSQGNRSARQSAHHTKQSVFAGSRRQLRGRVIRYLTKHSTVKVEQLDREFKDSRLPGVLRELERDGLLSQDKGVVSA